MSAASRLLKRLELHAPQLGQGELPEGAVLVQPSRRRGGGRGGGRSRGCGALAALAALATLAAAAVLAVLPALAANQIKPRRVSLALTGRAAAAAAAAASPSTAAAAAGWSGWSAGPRRCVRPSVAPVWYVEGARLRIEGAQVEDRLVRGGGRG